MESITYVLSIPPIIIPFIIKMIKPDLSLKIWIHSYENIAYFLTHLFIDSYNKGTSLH